MVARLGISWDDSKRGGAFLAVIAALLLTMTLPTAASSSSGSAGAMVDVIVRAVSGGSVDAHEAVSSVGGRATHPLQIVDGFVARVPRSAIPTLESNGSVREVYTNVPVHLSASSYDPESLAGSLLNVRSAVGATSSVAGGAGVGVAVLDSGVSPVPGLDGSGKIYNAPDFTPEASNPQLKSLDGYGHGTHMAGIIAGDGSDGFQGVAPNARIVNVKVADATGATTLIQVLLGMQWVIQHRNDSDANIKVLNLSFGTDGTQSYIVDPLTFAAEYAWRSGITVVVSAGNRGFTDARLTDPAYDPYVIAVGADNTNGTADVVDDVIPGWSSRGDGKRNPDLVAPGVSLVSLRDTGSYLDSTFPNAVVGDGYFRGSGTSQAAAVVSGAVADLLSQRPGLSPDQVKYLLTSTADPVPGSDASASGAGLVDLGSALAAATPGWAATQKFAQASGGGLLSLSAGSHSELKYNRWGPAMQNNSWSNNSWSNNSWSNNSWSNNSWSNNSWSNNSWSSYGWGE